MRKKAEKSRLSRAFLFLICEGLFVVLTGCSNQVATQKWAEEGFFPTTLRLREGDIFLARTSGFLPASAASLGEPKIAYSHAAVYFRDSEGRGRVIHMQPTGLQVISPEEFYRKYYLVGLVRNNSVNGSAISGACRELWQRHLEKPVVADFTGAEQEGGDGSMFCLTLLNYIYINGGGIAPFTRKWSLRSDPLARVIAAIAGAKHEYITAVPAIFSTSGFELISEWQRPDYDMRLHEIDNAIAEVAKDNFADGFYLRQPKIINRLWISTLLPARDLSLIFAGPGLTKMLRQISGVNDLAAMFTLNKYVKNSRKFTLEKMTHSTDTSPAELARESARELRERYFTKDIKKALVYPPGSACVK